MHAPFGWQEGQLAGETKQFTRDICVGSHGGMFPILTVDYQLGLEGNCETVLTYLMGYVSQKHVQLEKEILQSLQVITPYPYASWIVHDFKW